MRSLVLGVLLVLVACQDEQRPICGTVADCAGDPTCTDISCSGHICIYKNLPDQAPSPLDKPGDCKAITCDGNGGFFVNNDDTDLPVATGQCVTARCTDGVASTPPAQAGTSCGSGMYCSDSAQCVECIGPLQCPGTDTTCEARTCVNNACGVTFTASGTTCGTGKHCDGAGNCA